MLRKKGNISIRVTSLSEQGKQLYRNNLNPPTVKKKDFMQIHDHPIVIGFDSKNLIDKS